MHMVVDDVELGLGEEADIVSTCATCGFPGFFHVTWPKNKPHTSFYRSMIDFRGAARRFCEFQGFARENHSIKG